MTDLRIPIRDALREHEEERLSVDQVDAMRRVVLAAVRSDHGLRRRIAGLQPLAVAATVVAMIGAGVAIAARLDAARPDRAEDAAGPDSAGSAVTAPGRGARQLQFATPGGTRIIWIFNSDLDLKTTP